MSYGQIDSQWIRSSKGKIVSLSTVLITTISVFAASIAIQNYKVRDSEAAGKGKDVVFSVVSPSILTTPQREKYNKFVNENRLIGNTQVITVSDINLIAKAKSISIPLFEQGKMVIDRVDLKKQNGVSTWTGLNNGKFLSSISLKGSSAIGHISTSNNNNYNLIAIDNNLAILKQNKFIMTPSDEITVSDEEKNSETSSLEINNVSNSQPSEIKVLIAYTPEVIDFLGQDNFNTMSTTMINVVNRYFEQSGVVHRLSKTGTRRITGDTPNQMSVFTLQLQFSDDNKFDEIYSNVLPLPDFVSEADIVIALVGNNVDKCGAAGNPLIPGLWTTRRIAAIKLECAWSPRVWAHEIGHLLGADHDLRNRSPGNTMGTYNFGIVLPEAGTRGISSIMAFSNHPDCGNAESSNCEEIDYYSNPNIKVYSSPIGNITVNNVHVMNEVGLVVSSYYGGGGGSGGGGSCTSYGTSGCGGSCNSVCDCQDSSFSCSDISPTNPGNECWKDSCMISNPRNRRISGTVLDCSGNPKSGVTVASKGDFSRTTTTDSQGKFYLSESNNKCSVELDSGQYFYVVAGKDASSTATDYYGKVDNPVFSQTSISCATNVDCNYTANQASGGPTRKNYQLVVNAFASTPNVYNAFVCEEEPNYLSGFDFKQVNCPLACNASCTSDSQCSEANSSWYCASQFSDQSYQDNTSYVSTVSYKSGSDPTVKTESGPTTGINLQVVNGTIQQHLVKNGKLFYRENVPGQGWDKYWTDRTSDISSVGCNYFSDCGGTITGFNSYILPNGKREQHVLRKNNTSSKLFSRNNSSGWSQWVDSTSDVSSVDSGNNSGIVTSFNTYTHRDSYKLQTLVKGGKVYERNNLSGWSSWVNVTNKFDNCTNNSSCGNGTITSVERSLDKDGSDMLHLFRSSKLYSSRSTLSSEVCRSKSKPSSNTCG